MKNESLSDQLKIRTFVSHQELEQVLIRRMRAMQDSPDYISLLQFFYSYFGALEDCISLYIGPSELPDYLQRRKSDSLANDIISLGGTLPKKTAMNNLPVIQNQLQAFGALYVMEGSTLGGLIISKMIAKQLGITDKGISFFQSYGELLATMWTTFKLALNQQTKNEADQEMVITAADDTFRQFKALLNQV